MRILNLGCGEETEGTDFLDIYQARPEVVKQDLNKNPILPYPSEVFDEIICRGVLSHILNVGFLMEEMYRVLKVGGKVKIIVSNANYWSFSLFTSTNRWGDNELSKEKDYGTYFLFTDASIYKILEYYNFEVAKMEYVFMNEESKNFSKKWFKRYINWILNSLPIDKARYRTIYLEGIKKPKVYK